MALSCPLEMSMQVDCKAHTTKSGTWLTLQWLQKHVTTVASPPFQPVAQEGDVELNLCYNDELTIEQFNAPVITKHFGHGNIFQLRHTGFSVLVAFTWNPGALCSS